jgi:arylsulfatase A-like enzyme
MRDIRFLHPGKARRSTFALTLALLALVAGCARTPRLNLVVITIDTLRADHLSCYGYHRQTSPRIDAFAERGILLETVLCQSSQTLPSHASIFIGTNPRSHKAISHESPVSEDVTTLAEMLEARGYTTGAFISSHALDSKYRLDQGFDSYWEVHKERSYQARREAKEREDDFTTDAAISWLQEQRDSRFMLWIHWFHPHRPYNPPPRYLKQYAGDYAGAASSDPEFVMDVWRQEIELDPEDVQHIINRYDGEVNFTDTQVGRILDELETLGLLENTIVVITADHGEILYEHENYFGHDIALYDECLLIPLIVYAPGLEVGRPRIDGPVQSLDIMPTVLDLMEIEKPGYLEGQSLLGLIAGAGTSTAEYCFSETFPFPEKCPPRHAVRTADAKLIWKETKDGPIAKEFYDLANDPGETVNLYQTATGPAAHLDSVLTTWISHGGLHPAEVPTALESGRWRILKSLGYVD